MQKTLKNLALITTGLVVGVVIRRVGKLKVELEGYKKRKCTIKKRNSTFMARSTTPETSI